MKPLSLTRAFFGDGEALLDDGRMRPGAGGDHAARRAGGRDDEQPFAFEFLRGLSESPGVIAPDDVTARRERRRRPAFALIAQPGHSEATARAVPARP